MAMQVLTIDAAMRQRLAAKLRTHGEVLRFADDPALVSLCTCIGLQMEVGAPALDRLSPFWGVDGRRLHSECILEGSDVGIRWWRDDGEALELRHEDFRYVVDRASFDANGRLRQIVVFPARVAAQFRRRGFELVVVRDWFLTAGFGDEHARVNYLYANDWEIRNVVARTQAQLMQRRQLVFSGTHDVVDHLLGAEAEGYATALPTVSSALAALEEAFPGEAEETTGAHVVAYFLAVVLDDLAQPRWYRSTKHQQCAQRLANALPAARLRPWRLADGLPAGFHAMVAHLRAPAPFSLPIDSSALVESVFAGAHAK